MSHEGEVGNRIKQLRLAQTPKLTMTELAKRAGVTRNYVYLLESGQRGGTADVLARIGDALGVSVDYLLGGADRDEQGLPIAVPDLARLVHRLNELTPAERRSMSSLIEFVIDWIEEASEVFAHIEVVVDQAETLPEMRIIGEPPEEVKEEAPVEPELHPIVPKQNEPMPVANDIDAQIRAAVPGMSEDEYNLAGYLLGKTEEEAQEILAHLTEIFRAGAARRFGPAALSESNDLGGANNGV